MSGPQLERSVLEAKDREELFTIAEALGTNPTSRARKAELVNLILQATGVEVVAAPPPPARRTRRPAAPLDQPAPGAEAGDAGDDGGTASQVAGSAEGPTGTEAPPTPTAPPAVESARPGVESARPAVESARPGVESARPGVESARPAAPAATPAGEVSESVPEPVRAAAPPPRPAPKPVPAPASPDRPAASAADGQGGEGPGADDSEVQGGGAQAEPGNRRSRRRRGRDRAERAERDLPGQTPEQTFSGEALPVSGLVDLRDEGYGFLRPGGYLPSVDDVYVSINQVRRFSLRRGDQVDGGSRPAGGNEKYPSLVRVDTIGGQSPDEARQRPRFDALVPRYPDTKLVLEGPGDDTATLARVVDLIAPIGKGQRGVIVAPPKAGRTTVLRQLAQAIEANNPDVVLLVLLIDERPEDVTELRQAVKAEVIGSTFDRPADEHTQVAELVVERAKRLVEVGGHVVVLADGIGRLARAYNQSQPATGRALPGGIDTGALYATKHFFGAARNTEEGGSLTIIGTVSVDTGSRIDEVIADELRGTANMELYLDAGLAGRRLFPAVDVLRSSTRHDEDLVDPARAGQLRALRQALATAAQDVPLAGAEWLAERLAATATNAELLDGFAATAEA